MGRSVSAIWRWIQLASQTSYGRAQAEDLQALRSRILELKTELDAVILAHNYQWGEVQDVADFVGDSLELSRRATTVQAKVIVFCGVHFMAESAAILNPDKTVLLPEPTAGCPMADMIDAPTLREWKARYPDAAVVCYVNSSAEVKAESDICCTSANAVGVVEALPHKRILFVPDQNLGHFVASQVRKEMVLYPGYCPTHRRVKPSDVEQARRLYPEAEVLVHPECDPEVVALADAALSTSQMLRHVASSQARSFLLGTEAGILHRLTLHHPDKTFMVLSRALLCPNMKKTRLESVVRAMETRQTVITVAEDIRLKAKRALDRMLEVG